MHKMFLVFEFQIYDIIIMKLAPIVQNRFTNRTLWTYSGS